ncbi:MAG TPA: sigma-70 family RNA polymerase sigma factor [Pseudomonadales bacterium]|nr:sigma-70 family RNA polymerase sigma factor [Pseudomonadales bacterium]
MTNLNTIEPMEADDTRLVNESLTGNREAFGQIVTRYQTLICSLAYSATGSFSQSQDLAQETFVTAWKRLSELREPGKLRAWLCGILKNRVYKTYRRDGHEPSHAAESLETAQDLASGELPPSDHAITKEEESILWRSLGRVPEIYREPLILFYREHQSIETVAANLELSEDAVKQRLSRGRKMLQEEVMSFVEGALERTSPDKTFTLNVLAALPAVTISAKAATLGAVAAKGTAAAKTAGMMGLLGAVLTPLLVIFGNYASYRMSMDEARTDEERGHIKRTFMNSLYVTLVLAALCAVPLYWSLRNHQDLYLFWSLFFSQTIVLYFLTLLAFVIRSFPYRQRFLAKILADEHGGKFPEAACEYCSRWSLLGLPLIHVRIGDRFDVIRGPVKAWIAIGSSHAVGVVFAAGGLAVAPISFGGIAIGVLSFGAISMGVFPMGAIALGFCAFGGIGFGWQVCAGVGAALHAAMGGVTIARDFATGGIAHAAQANTDAAKQFFQQNLFFRIAQAVGNHGMLTMLIWIIPVSIQSWLVGRARRRSEQANA